MIEHLPALVILLPLLSAPLCMLVRRRGVALAVIAIVAWCTFGLAVKLLVDVRAGGERLIDPDRDVMTILALYCFIVPGHAGLRRRREHGQTLDRGCLGNFGFKR